MYDGKSYEIKLKARGHMVNIEKCGRKVRTTYKFVRKLVPSKNIPDSRRNIKIRNTDMAYGS